MQVVVPERDARARAQILHEPERSQRIGSAVDDVPHEDEAGVVGELLDEAFEALQAALYVADGDERSVGHGVRSGCRAAAMLPNGRPTR